MFGVFLLLFSLVRMGTCYNYNMHSFAFGNGRRRFKLIRAKELGDKFAVCLEPDGRRNFWEMLKELETSGC